MTFRPPVARPGAASWSRGVACAAAVLLFTSCAGDDDAGTPASETVRARIAALAPAADLGHRGSGINRPGHPFPENSLSSFAEGIRQGADGVELDVELTADGALLIMHDDRLDRTTDCAGCVSAYRFADARACHLLDGDGNVTGEHPPTLDEVYALLPADALVNIELKVYGERCATSGTGATALADAAVAAVERLGVAARTIFSSFDLAAVKRVKELRPDFYAAYLLLISNEESIAPALDGSLDALHPFYAISAELTQRVLDSGAQVNFWTVDDAAAMNDSLEKGATAIITDLPGLLREVLAAREEESPA